MPILRDVVYVERSQRALEADVYLPNSRDSIQGRDPRDGRAAIIWLHGGGWRFGNRRQSPPLDRYFAARGYVMVSIDYRRSPEAVFPAAVQDVKAAISWLARHARDFQVDPQRIGLWGSSAGGHLAALAALSDPTDFVGDDGESAQVAAVMDGYGPTDFLQMDAHRDVSGKPSDDPESIQLPPGMTSASPDSLESRFLGAPIETCPELVRRANPVTYVSPKAPPFLIMHGSADTAVPVHQSVLLHRALVGSGNQSTLGVVRKLGHGFLNRAEIDQQEWEVELSTSDTTDAGFEGVTLARPFTLIGDWFDRHL